MKPDSNIARTDHPFPKQLVSRDQANICQAEDLRTDCVTAIRNSVNVYGLIKIVTN